MIHKCERWKSSHRKNSGFTKKKKKNRKEKEEIVRAKGSKV